MTNLYLAFDRDRFYMPEVDEDDTGEKGGEPSDVEDIEDTDEENQTRDEDTRVV